MPWDMPGPQLLQRLQSKSLFRQKSLVAIRLPFKALGCPGRDELVLSTLMTIGMTCNVFFYAVQPGPILPPCPTGALAEIRSQPPLMPPPNPPQPSA